MSFNQSRADRSDSSQYKKLGGRSGTSAQPRNFSGGSGKGGGGPAPPPSSISTNSSLSSNRSFKRPNNAQGGQSRVSGVGVNPDSSYASAARTLQNGTHLQPSAQADAPVAGVPLKPTTDMATQKSTQAGPKAPSSQPAIVNSDSTPPATPAKPSGEASKSFPLQFGSISPGFVNGMQSFPCYMGQFLWPNMLPHNMRPTMAEGRAILPFSPSMAQGGTILPNMAQGGTGAGFDQFFYNFLTSQSNIPSLFNSEVWRGQSSIMKVWGGGQSSLMES